MPSISKDIASLKGQPMFNILTRCKELERKGYEAASAWLDNYANSLSKEDSYTPPSSLPKRKTAVRTMALAT